MRFFHLIWLAEVEYVDIGDDAVEPLPGIGPLTGALEAFAMAQLSSLSEKSCGSSAVI